MKIETNGDRVRNAYQVFSEQCRNCTGRETPCYDCEIDTARAALIHVAPVGVEYDRCSACGEEIGKYDRFCSWCGSPLVGRGSDWE